jgi:hypothetical protein
MVILAAGLGVLEPGLTIAACSGGRDPFVRPMHARAESDASRARFIFIFISIHLFIVVVVVVV